MPLTSAVNMARPDTGLTSELHVSTTLEPAQPGDAHGKLNGCVCGKRERRAIRTCMPLEGAGARGEQQPERHVEDADRQLHCRRQPSPDAFAPDDDEERDGKRREAEQDDHWAVDHAASGVAARDLRLHIHALLT